MNRIRVATYNIHKCRGMDWRVNTSRISKVIREIDADIIAVQEIFGLQAECLAKDLKLAHVFGGVRELEGQEYGNAVFTRLSILEAQPFSLTIGGREPRGCLRVCIAPGPVQFFAVHLGTSFFERRRQAMKLVSEEILEQPRFKGLRIVAGDFNEWTRGLASQLLSRCLRSADLAAHLNRSRTYPGLLPFLHLDHIYYDPAFHLSEMHLYRTPTALAASDHLPLLATFTGDHDSSMLRRCPVPS